MNRKRDYVHLRHYYNILIPLLLLFQITLPGIVLCFGADGHIALENKNVGYCCGSISISMNTQQSDLKTIGYSESTHCGDCTDIRISENSSGKKVVSSNELESHIGIYAFVVYVLSLPMFEETSMKKTLIQESPKTNPSLDSLQTTILIC
ncbi:MAG: hypothetical protein AB1598_03765 [Thermodesulfobacteriota bacterium]